MLGWAEKASPKAMAFAMKTIGFKKPEEAPEAFVRFAAASVAETVVFPMQDVLGLGGDARMNLPGSPDGNWLWRMKPGAASEQLARRLRLLNKETGRL